MVPSVKKLPLSFYLQTDVVTIAQNLLGKLLMTKQDGIITGGIITETEAYGGITDKACHAYNGRYTARTKTLYEIGGITYVYFCYGMHHLLNIVTNKKEVPEAVLIRGIQPLINIDIMKKRLNYSKLPKLLNGPGKVCKALDITKKDNEESLLKDKIWIEEFQIKIPKTSIKESKRIGVDYAGHDAERLWRFYIDNAFPINSSVDGKK
jgi:DNA-3-methyladenine glycosylase